MNRGSRPAVQFAMKRLHTLLFVAALTVAGGCASVSTEVVRYNPAQSYAPTQNVEVLLQKPERAHVEIALLESRGGSEAALLNDARARARELGADAIVRVDTEKQVRPPVAYYDPWFHDPFWGPHAFGHFGHGYYSPYPYGPWGFGHPWGPYGVGGVGVVPGGVHYVLKATAIKYTGN